MRTIVSLSALFVVVLVEGVVSAQPGQDPLPPPARYPAQPYPAQPYPAQPYPAPYPGQPYPGQPYPYPPVQLSADDQALLQQGEISDGRYIGGGIASLFFGWGIGQAIQGRYSDTGKIFTIGEAGTLTAVVVGAIGTIDSEGTNSGSNALLIGGLIGFAGFRVWEIVDAFTGPPSHNAQVRQLRMRLGLSPVYARVKPYIAPSMSRTGISTAGLTFRF
ncbi:MAG TPA: hypothetical protein VF469_20195 [Kofleriaceae bacterium]